MTVLNIWWTNGQKSGQDLVAGLIFIAFIAIVSIYNWSPKKKIKN